MNQVRDTLSRIRSHVQRAPASCANQAGANDAGANQAGAGNGSRIHFGWMRPLSVLILWQLLVLSGCAGYQIGNRSLYRSDLKTVHVPIFQSNSLRLDLGEWLTEAVVKEIERRTPYKVVSTPLADSVLAGRLMWDTKRVLSENIDDFPRDLLLTLTVHVTWIDHRGQILLQEIVRLDADFVPESGQSVTSAKQKVMQRLASKIVSDMEALNW